jgi:hypothetical protein
MFSKDLLEHGVPLFHSTIDPAKLSPEEAALEKKRMEYYTQQYRIDLTIQRAVVNGETKVISPITASTEFEESKSEEMQHLNDACAYMIMMASFMHTWANEHQYEDIG